MNTSLACFNKEGEEFTSRQGLTPQKFALYVKTQFKAGVTIIITQQPPTTTMGTDELRLSETSKLPAPP